MNTINDSTLIGSTRTDTIQYNLTIEATDALSAKGIAHDLLVSEYKYATPATCHISDYLGDESGAYQAHQLDEIDPIEHIFEFNVLVDITITYPI